MHPLIPHEKEAAASTLPQNTSTCTRAAAPQHAAGCSQLALAVQPHAGRSQIALAVEPHAGFSQLGPSSTA